MNKFIDLAKKIKVLAEKGIDGEKENAELQLKKLMQKHGFTLQDIEGEKKDVHYFKVPDEGKVLFAQIVSTILGKEQDVFVAPDINSFAVFTTVADAVEIESKFDFYFKLFSKEQDIFYAAFIKANDLYPKDGRIREVSELSPEEYKRAMKVQRMAEGIDAQNFLKQIKKS